MVSEIGWPHPVNQRCYAILDRKKEPIREGTTAVDLLPVSEDEMTVHRLTLEPVWDPLRKQPRFRAVS